MSAPQARRSGPNHSDLAAAAEPLFSLIQEVRIDLREIERIGFDPMSLTNKALKSTDGYRGIQRSSSAFGFTRSCANSTTNGRKGVWSARDDIGVLISAFCDRLDVSPGIRSNRAPFAAQNLTREVVDVGQFDLVRGGHNEPGVVRSSALYLSYLAWTSLVLVSAALFSAGVALPSFSSTMAFLRRLES